jgi:hypothetical protein
MKTKKVKPLLAELNDEERNVILPTLLTGLKLKTSDMRHLTKKEIIKWFLDNKDKIGFKCAFNDQRLMKLTNYIRVNALAPLCATNDGYWITRNPNMIREMILSFENRVASQQAAIKGLRDQLNEIELEGEFGLFEML